MKTLSAIIIGFLSGVALATVLDIHIPSSEQSISVLLEHTILDVTELPAYLTAEDKANLLKQEGRNGQIVASTSMAGFEVYEVDKRLVIVKDRYIRGLFDLQSGTYGVFPRSNKVLLGEGPFIYYYDPTSTVSNSIVDQIEYSNVNSSRIFIDYWLDGIDFIKTRYKKNEINPRSIYTRAWGFNSYLSEVIFEGHHCIAIPLAGDVMQEAMACCQSNNTGEVSLMDFSSPKINLEPVLQPLTEEDVAEKEGLLASWSIYAETRQACLDNFEAIKHKSWHSFEPYEPQ